MLVGIEFGIMIVILLFMMKVSSIIVNMCMGLICDHYSDLTTALMDIRHIPSSFNSFRRSLDAYIPSTQNNNAIGKTCHQLDVNRAQTTVPGGSSVYLEAGVVSKLDSLSSHYEVFL